MELVKNVGRWGNSAGILLPKEWLGNQVKIILIEGTLNIKKEVFKILDKYLSDILGIYLVGSYSRNEQTERSDIDILVITGKTNERVEQGKYSILLVSKDVIETKLKKDALPIIPMIKEARPILNAPLIEEYKKIELTKRNLRWHIDTTKSALKMNKSIIDFCRDYHKKCPAKTAYSLILRLRESYIVDCLIKGTLWNAKEFISFVKKIAGSLNLYEVYLEVKEDKSGKNLNINLEEADKVYQYISKKIKEQEEWARKKKIRKGIESLKKNVEEHRRKIEEYKKSDGRNYALIQYWEREIEQREEEIEKELDKLEDS